MQTAPAQSSLFTLDIAPRHESESRCAHPPAAQVVLANLFTGKRDLVCDDCHATLAQNWRE
jgi:hypothetical protein